MTDQEFAYLTSRIHKLTGIDLDCYKTQQMRRRLDGFVRAQGLAVQPFCALIERDRQALAKLRNFLTINVSEFFRDAKQFELLQTMVLPEILRQTPRVNAWSAGCSIGAEPYTLAMMLSELSPLRSHRILATDLDDRALAKAKAGGPYIESEIKNVPKALRAKYFTTVDGQLWVTERVRQHVQCQKQNLLSDSFERGFDLILCRNVIIYFTDDTKTKLNERFSRALKPGGWLFIGGAETLMNANEVGFERRCASLYQKVAVPVRSAA